MSSESTTLKFEIYRDGEFVRTEELSQAIIKVGKLPSSHLRLDDANVSRIHAVIERSGEGEVYIIDLGSSKGTQVNGKRVNKCQLNSGDEITLGSTTIKVTIDRPQPAAPVAGAVVVDYGAGANAGAFAASGDSTQLGGQVAPGAAAGDQPQGWYDESGNWHDGMGGYYDPDGNYHTQYGGWYDTAGNYFDGKGGYYDPAGEYHMADAMPGAAAPVVRDVDIFSEQYLEKDYDSSGSGTLEVAFLWNDHIVAVDHYDKAPTITIGESKKNTFSLKHESIPDGEFPLLQPSAGGVTVNFTSKMDGLVYIDDKRYTIEEAMRNGTAQQGSYGQGSYSINMSSRTRIRLDFGLNTILIHYANVPKGVPIGGLSLDGSLIGYTTVSFALHMAFMFLAFYLPPDADGFELDSFDLNNRFVTQIVKPEEEIPEEEEPEWLDEKDETKSDEKRAAGAEGKAGKEDVKVKNKKVAVKGPADNTELKIAKDREVAYNSGALSVLNRSALAATFGSGDVTAGFDPVTAMGDGKGDVAGDAYGFGAFGTTGMGRGGGGVSEKGFGIGGGGGFGTVSRNGKGGKSNYGKGEGNLQERATKVPQVVGGSPAVRGSLSKEIIRRVIRRHIREVKYCYEQELIKNKGLAGRVVMNFTISATGRVAAAAPVSNSVNGKVGSCIASKVRRWVFPEPKGGGIVVVTYPFVFSAK